MRCVRDVLGTTYCNDDDDDDGTMVEDRTRMYVVVVAVCVAAGTALVWYARVVRESFYAADCSEVP